MEPPAAILIDNLKTGVLEHRFGQRAVFNPRYLDFAAHYGFEPRACTVRKANEKGRVENFVGYVKKNLLAGFVLPHSLSAIKTAGRHWLDTIAIAIANISDHKETRQQPAQLFAATEKPALRPLPPVPADISVARTVRVTNRYSVPHLYASQQLTLHAFPDRLCLYYAHQLVATHPRCYERHRDFEDPDHVKELLDQRRRARDAKWLLTFYALSPHAEFYHQQLKARHLNKRIHINKIVALTEIHGPQKVALAIEDAMPPRSTAAQPGSNPCGT